MSASSNAPAGQSWAEWLGAQSDIEFAAPVLVYPATGRSLLPTEEILVKLGADTSPEALANVAAAQSVSVVRAVPYTTDEYVLRIDNPKSDPVAISRALYESGLFHWAEPNFIQHMHPMAAPNDPRFGQQWHLENTGALGGTPGADVKAPAAWSVEPGNASTVIAVIDDGVELTHEDLKPNRFENPGEIPSNGIDDDGNSYIDDVSGWDFATDDNDPSPSLATDNHGTAVAGVAAARANNGLGVSGVCQLCRILPVRVAIEHGLTGLALGNAIRYAATLADVINCSWGGDSPPFSFVRSAIAFANTNGRGGKGALVMFASGNDASGLKAYPITGIPAGTHRFRWTYSKDWLLAAGDDTAWLSWVIFPGGQFESFQGGVLPSGWSTGGDAGWAVVTDPVHTDEGMCLTRAARAGGIRNSQTTYIEVVRTVPAGSVSSYQWVSSELGSDGLSIQIDFGNDGSIDVDHPMAISGVPTVNQATGWPANDPGAIAVGATSDRDCRSQYSQFGPELAFVAPSNNGPLSLSVHLNAKIATTDRTGAAGDDAGEYTQPLTASGFGGTSSATPLAAGIAGLVISRNPTLTRTQVLQILQNSSDQVGPEPYVAGRNNRYGSGRLNAHAALLATPPPPAIHVTSPDGGEAWSVGTQHNVTWTSGGLDPSGQVYVVLSLDGGVSDYPIPLAVLPPGATTYAWTPAAPHATTAGRVFVGNLVNGAYEAQDWSNGNFTIAATPPPPTTTIPSVTTGVASAVTQTSATLSATVNPNGASTTLYFDYGSTLSYGITATYGFAGADATAVARFYDLTGLACGTTYQVRARAQNGNGTSNGGNQTFTTSACSPQSGLELLINGSFASGSSGWGHSGSVFADARFANCRTCPGYAYVSDADGTGGNSLLGSLFQTVTIPANATSAALTFWYHITTQETSATTPFDVLNVTVQDSSGGFLGTVVTLSNLNKTTGYVQVSSNVLAFASAGQTIRLHFLATTDSQLPTVFRVDDVSLLVAASTMGPTVTTGSPTAINPTGATLNGTVNPNGSATSAWFQYGTTTSYGSSTASQNLGAGTSQVAANASVSGLTCGTLYHVRVAGQNGVGSQQGTDQTFTTNACGSTAGTIRVSIVPQAAADAGAQWKLTTETAWHHSGAIIPVPSLTTYTVEFRTILGWTTPANKTVVLFPAQTDVWIDSDPYVQQAIVPLYEYFSGIGFGSSEFVAVGGAYSLVTTPDGVNWARRAGLNDLVPEAVSYAAGIWVAVGHYNAGRIMTSPNARDWTSRFTDPSVVVRRLTFGQGLHVAAGSKVVTSPDGVNWTVRNVPAFGYGTMTGIAFGSKTFVAVTEGGMALTSGDAITWNVVTPPDAGSYLGSVAHGNSLFVAVGWAGKILTSPDGTNWTWRASGTGDLLTGVTYANGTFVAVGDGGRVVTSPDGVNWTSRNGATANNLRAVAFGNNTFVAAGWSGTLISLGNAFQPLIVSQPASQTTVSGGDVTFGVAAAGPGPFTYQWQFEGADLTGQTSASLSLQGVTPSQAGKYAVVVQSPFARQVSQPAALTVNAKSTPAITWASPATIVEGTALSSTQLNASSSVVGTFVYTPPMGATLNAGAGQTLSLLFTPTDTTNFTTAIASVAIDVTPSVPEVTVTATDANASEVGLDPGTFRFTRTGATTAALTVNVMMAGTATVAADYTDVGWTTVTIPVGSTTATKTVTPVADALVEGTETVGVTLAAGGYTIGALSAATVTIADVPMGPTVTVTVTGAYVLGVVVAPGTSRAPERGKPDRRSIKRRRR